MVIESDRPIARGATELGVSAGLLGKRVKQERQRQGRKDGMSEADPHSENARLRRELAEARLDNEFLSKATAFFALMQREQNSFQLMQQEKAKFSALNVWLGFFKISRSGYYAWAAKNEAKRIGHDPRQVGFPLFSGHRIKLAVFPKSPYARGTTIGRSVSGSLTMRQSRSYTSSSNSSVTTASTVPSAIIAPFFMTTRWVAYRNAKVSS